jgi:hypothetical protein
MRFSKKERTDPAHLVDRGLVLQPQENDAPVLLLPGLIM